MKIVRIIKSKIQRKKNKFWYNKINPCKKCGSKGYLARHGKGWMIGCLGLCCNGTKVHNTRIGALKEWNI